jgi:hypothetical protein
MIKSITNKYYEYNPNEFLPIFYEGVLANRKEFHAYKAKQAAKALGAALAPLGNRIDSFFVNH